jgi:hypothetical protein
MPAGWETAAAARTRAPAFEYPSPLLTGLGSVYVASAGADCWWFCCAGVSLRSRCAADVMSWKNVTGGCMSEGRDDKVLAKCPSAGRCAAREDADNTLGDVPNPTAWGVPSLAGCCSESLRSLSECQASAVMRAARAGRSDRRAALEYVRASRAESWRESLRACTTVTAKCCCAMVEHCLNKSSSGSLQVEQLRPQGLVCSHSPLPACHQGMRRITQKLFCALL